MAGSGDDSRIAQVLLGWGRLGEGQLQAALQEQARRGASGTPARLGTVLVEWGVVSEQDVRQAYSHASAPRAAEANTVDAGSGGAPLAPAPPLAPRGLSPSDTQEVLDASKSRTAKHVGPYLVLRELGRGGMGVVLKAYDPRVDRLVAVKQLLGMHEERHRRRFQREARLAGKLNHPGIATVYESGEANGAPYLVIQLVSGGSLEELCEATESERLDVREAARLVQKICEAMAYAHSMRVLHRDLKPQNVLVTPDGVPVVVDFGLARDLDTTTASLTKTGDVLGSYLYMAPEQARGDKGRVGPATDVYALGAILHRCLTGQPPLIGDSAVEVVGRVLRVDPDPPSKLNSAVPSDLDRICLQCLEKDPSRRYPNAGALADDLRRFQDGEPIEARTVPRIVRFARRAWQRRALSAMVLLVGLLLLGGTVTRLVLTGMEEELAAQKRRSREDLEAKDLELNARTRESARRREKLQQGLVLTLRLTEALQFRHRPLHEDPEEEERFVKDSRRQAAGVLTGLERLLAEAPDLVDLQIILGRAHLQLLNLDRALFHARRAIQLDAGSGKARLLLARALLARVTTRAAFQQLSSQETKERADETKEAARCFEEARELGEPFDLPLVRAWSAMAAGEFDVAKGELERLKTRTEESELAWAVLTRRTPEGAEASLEHAEAALRLCPRMLPALIMRATFRLSSGDLDGAIADYDRALLLKPDFVFANRVLINRGNAKRDKGEQVGALADYDRAVNLRPEFVVGYSNRSNAKRDMGDLDGALEDGEQALRLDAGFASAWNVRGLAKYMKGDLDGALDDFEQAIRLDPDYPDPYCNRGNVKSDRRDFAGAIADFDATLRLRPNDPAVLVNRANAERNAGNLKAALADFTEALRLDPDRVNALVGRGLTRGPLGDVEGAIADFDRAIEIDPESAAAFNGRGLSRRARNDLAGALADFEEALRLDPNEVSALGNRAKSRLDKGDYAGAVADFDRALELDPKNPELHHGRAVVRAAGLDLDGAIADYSAAIRLDPKRAESLQGRGSVRIQRGDLAGAIVDYDAAIQLLPELPGAYCDRARAKGMGGDFAGAIADATEAIRLDPLFVGAYMNRAVARMKTGDRRGAGLDFEQFLRLAPTHARASALRTEVKVLLGRPSRY